MPFLNMKLFTALDQGYAAGGFTPPFIADFANDIYYVDGVASTFADAFSFSRSGTATYLDSAGVRQVATTQTPRTASHYYNGSAWVPEGIYLESFAATNLERNSSAPLAGFSGNVNVTWATGQTDRDGGSGASHLLATSGTSAKYRAFGNDTISFVSGNYYAKSYTITPLGSQRYVTVVAAGAGFAGNGRNVIFDLVAGTVTFEETGSTNAFGFIMDLGDGSYRCTGVFRCNSTTTAPDSYYIALTNSPTSAVPSYSTSTSNGVSIAETQIEEGQAPSSYIPTSGSAVTRNADLLIAAWQEIPDYTTAFSAKMSGRFIYLDTNQNPATTFYKRELNTQNLINVYLRTNAGTGGLVFLQESGNVLDSVVSGGSVFADRAFQDYSIASRHTDSEINGAFDGTAFSANTTPTTLADLGTSGMFLGQLYSGSIREFLMWPDDIGNAGAEETTA